MTKAQLALKAIEKYLEDLQDVAEAESILEAMERGEVETISLEDLERELGLER
jgi:RHH-type rel operon transcriptional repressor/antitoxin RelB